MTLDPQTVLLMLLAAPVGGLAGWLHFATLARVADLFVAGRLSAVGLQLARLAVLGAFLWLCSRGGAAVLIAGAAGVLAGRAIVMRKGGGWKRP
ncbi:MAG: hypothetical protein KDA50_06905 [Rhodobacteraceae bacterium]|nr:hypothetical protein [Paracoccaceae bacterium]